MMDLALIKNFFEDGYNQSLLNDNRFEELYKEFAKIGFRCELTKLFLDANIDFLKYLENIPPYCFKNIQDSKIESLDIPESVLSLEPACFKNSCIKEISLYDTIEKIAGVIDSNIKTIKYKGNKEQFRSLVNSYDYRHSHIIKVLCNDGELKF